jgi:hypothetical protein
MPSRAEAAFNKRVKRFYDIKDMLELAKSELINLPLEKQEWNHVHEMLEDMIRDMIEVLDIIPAELPIHKTRTLRNGGL